MRFATKPRRDVLLLVLVALGSLILDTASERFLHRFFGETGAWISALHLLPLAISIALYLACGPGDSWKPPRGEIKRGWLAFPIWAAMTAAFFGLMLLANDELSKSEIALQTLDFMLLHVIGMQLLFQGALMSLAERIWPPTLVSVPGGSAREREEPSLSAILVVTLVFGLSQLQYHPTILTWAPWRQVLGALGVGLFITFGRTISRSVWGAAVVHAGSNLLGALH
jgi:hypothetical protein